MNKFKKFYSLFIYVYNLQQNFLFMCIIIIKTNKCIVIIKAKKRNHFVKAVLLSNTFKIALSHTVTAKAPASTLLKSKEFM